MTLTKGTPVQFRRHVPGLWMIDRAAFRGKVRLFMFFTCPMPFCTGVINKVHIAGRHEEEGTFECLYCKSCRTNLSLYLNGFSAAYEREVRKLERLTSDKMEITV